MPGVDPPTTEQPDPSPCEVAGYRLLRFLGEGGMSTVFLSYDIIHNRPVAIKLLADHLAGSREFVDRFYREARLSRLLTHPKLVQAHAAGFDSRAVKHYLVLEFIDGPTAHATLQTTGLLPIGAAVQVGIDIAEALAFLHSRQYIHRDVKPDNILLHPDGTAKLADMGLAKRLNDDPQLTASTQGVGTSFYMAYEQALNSNLVDARSDIFALGATLYHLLTGEVPFPGSTHEEVIRSKAHDTFRPLRALNPDVPPVLESIIHGTLARDPRARCQSAEWLAESLRATRLATTIPRFDSTNPEGNRDASAAPTRADLQTQGRDAHTPTSPAAPTASYPVVSSSIQPGGSSVSGSRVGIILAAIASLALFGVGLAGVIAVLNRQATAPSGPAPEFPDPYPSIPSDGRPASAP